MRRRPGSPLRVGAWLLAVAVVAAGGSAASAQHAITGRIVGAPGATGQPPPLRGIRLELFEWTDRYHQGMVQLGLAEQPRPVASTLSDQHGRYLLPAPAPGLYRVSFETGGQVLGGEPGVLGERYRPIELARARELRITLRAPDGSAVTGVVLLAPQRPPWQESWLSLPVGRRLEVPAGRLTVALPEAQTARISAVAAGFPVSTLEVAPGRRAVTVALEPGQSVALRVSGPDGKPAAHAVVMVAGLALARTDERGTATILLGRRPLPAEIASAGGGFLETLLSAPAEKGPIELTLLPPAVIEGDVINEDGIGEDAIDKDQGRPIAGALVIVAGSGATMTDATGSYRLPPIPARGSCQVQVLAPGYVDHRRSVDHCDGSTPLRMKLTRALILSGSVEDGAGAPVTGASVAAQATSGETDGSGRFELAGLAERFPLELEVRARGFAQQRIEVLDPGVPIRVVLAPGRRAVGWVLGANEAPIPGAEIELSEYDSRANRRFASPSFRSMSDEQGRFAVEDLAPGRYRLKADAPGFAPAEIPGVDVPGPGDDGPVELGTVKLDPAVQLEGRVVDAGGNAIAGAEATVRRGSEYVQAVSDPLGGFVIPELAAGTSVSLQLSHPDFVTAHLDETRLPTEKPVVIVLEPGVVLAGRVQGESGEPIAGAELRLRGVATSGLPRMGASGRSGSAGEFRLDGIAAGTWSLDVTAEGYRDEEIERLVITHDAPPGDLTVTLRRGVTLSGRVLDPEGRPLEGAHLRSVETTGAGRRNRPWGPQPPAARSQVDGGYEILGLPQGRVTIVAVLREYQELVRDVELGPEGAVLDLRLEPALEIRGRVLDLAGMAVPGAYVSLTSPDGAFHGTTSDGQGEFRFSAEPGRRYDLNARKRGLGVSRKLEGLEVGEASIAGLELVLEPGARIAGTVRGLDVDELAVLFVRLSGPTGYDSFGPGYSPDYEGRFVIEDVAPGDWQVSAYSRGTEVSEAVTVEPGVHEVRVQLDFESGSSLSGLVLEGEDPVPGLSVHLAGPTAAGGQTDQEGRFALAILEHGRYDLTIRRGALLVHRESLELSGDLELTVELTDTRLAGRVVDAGDGLGLSGARLSLEPAEKQVVVSDSWNSTTTRGEGRFAYQGVAPGDYRLSVSRPDYATRSIAVTIAGPPGPDDLEVALERARGLTLIVIEPDGRPVRMVGITTLTPDGQPIARGFLSAGEGGRIEVRDLADGSWWLQLQTLGAMADVDVTVPVGGEPKRVQLEWAGEVEVALPELGASPSPRYRVHLFDAGGRPARLWATGSSRVYSQPLRVGPLRAGPWRLEVELEDGEVLTTSVTVTPRGLSRVTLP